VSIDVDALLAEISPDAPCGEDLSYDPAFMELDRVAQGTPETQVGDYVQEGEEPDWKAVRSGSLDLMSRTKDLRVILYLTLSSLCLDGLPGFRDGLALLRGVLERYWDHVFPQLDPDDNNDPLERMNIISSLSPPQSAMSDTDPMRFRSRVMAAKLCQPGDTRLPRVSLHDILVASGELSGPADEDAAPPQMSLIEAAFENTPVEDLQAMDQTVRDCQDHIEAMDTFLMEQVGAGSAPNLGEIKQVLKQVQVQVADFLEKRGYGEGEAAAAAEAGPGVPPQQAPPGQISSKSDVLKAMDRIIDYYEKNEPSSPVPLLIKRAKRLVGKSFVDIIRDISPDAMSQVTTVSGDRDEEPEE
jgi:type VI secretion system protein ImpA